MDVFPRQRKSLAQLFSKFIIEEIIKKSNPRVVLKKLKMVSGFHPTPVAKSIKSGEPISQ